jgi:hypothetical protein
MRVTFEITDDKNSLVAVHDGDLGLLIATGMDWDMLRDSINESVASAAGRRYEDIEIELIIDEVHVTRFKHVYGDDVAERIRRRSGSQ